jgi:hypothetical protein
LNVFFRNTLMSRDALEKAFPKRVVIGWHQRFAKKVAVRISRDRLINVFIVVDKITLKRIRSVLSLQCMIHTFVAVILIIGFRL